MDEGILVPAPKIDDTNVQQWYRVRKQILTGRAKLGYHLTPTKQNPVNQPDILVYRGTSVEPYLLDSFTSVVTDSYPFACPGYYGRRAGEAVEKDILDYNQSNPIKIIGYSLGGSFAQLTLLNRIKEVGKEVTSDLPNREIKAVLFDSPAISSKDNRMFAQWVKKNPEQAKKMSFQYYFSKNDPVPGGGDVHLGSAIYQLGSVSCSILKRLNPKNHTLQFNPHQRFHFITRPDVDYKETKITLEEFDNQSWRIVADIVRRIVGLILCPIILVLGTLSRLIFGWRGDAKHQKKHQKKKEGSFLAVIGPPPLQSCLV